MPERKKRIPRYAELPKSTKRIPSRRKDPSKRTWAKHRCDPYREWLKRQPCVVTGARTGQYLSAWLPPYREGPILVVVDPAHLIPKGRGSDDLNNCVSLARHLHESQEKRTDAFNAEWGVNLWEIAKQQTAEWLATDEGRAWQREHGDATE